MRRFARERGVLAKVVRNAPLLERCVPGVRRASRPLARTVHRYLSVPNEMLPQYRVGYLRQLLAKDPRTNLLDVEVRVVGERVFIIGTVESSVLRASAEKVVREAVPREMEVVNELCVIAYVP